MMFRPDLFLHLPGDLLEFGFFTLYLLDLPLVEGGDQVHFSYPLVDFRTDVLQLALAEIFHRDLKQRVDHSHNSRTQKSHGQAEVYGLFQKAIEHPQHHKG